MTTIAVVDTADAIGTSPEFAPWVCRAAIAPRIWQEGESLWLESNGSEGCYGGWELRFPTPIPSAHYRLTLEAEGWDLPRGADALVAEAFWRDGAGREVDWHPLFLEAPGGAKSGALNGSNGSAGHVVARFGAPLRAPEGADRLHVRCGLRWASRGRVRWHRWRLERTEPPAPRPIRLGVASAKPPRWVSQEANAAHYLDLCRQAGAAGVELLCLPELILTYRMPEKTPEAVHAAARPIPGEWLTPFQDVARAHGMALCFSVYERAGADGEIVYNTAVLVGQDGALAGTYRKVHLALREARNGIAAGHEFPVFSLPTKRTGPVRVGMAICMDSTPLESARLLALNGAEVLLTPINGDYRAAGREVWGKGEHAFHRGRWETIQRAHALDNYLYAVTARNDTEGSCIASPWGELLAYDDGSHGIIAADVDLAARPAHHTGASIHAVLRTMRRPAVYGRLTATSTA